MALNLGYSYRVGPDWIFVRHHEVMTLSARLDTYNRVIAHLDLIEPGAAHRAELVKTAQWAGDVLIEALAGSCGEATVQDFEVRDYGEDGSQYFPGATTYCTSWDHVQVGCGDTACEALEDALEQMAGDEPEANLTPRQEALAFDSLSEPDRSAHTRCAEIDADLPGAEADCSEHDWHHYVAVFYTLRSEVK